MNAGEVAVGTHAPALGGLRVLVVDPEEPTGVLAEAVLLDELVLLTGRRLVLTPGVTLVVHVTPLVDQLLGVVERLLVQLDRHSSRSCRPAVRWHPSCAAYPRPTTPTPSS